MAVGDRQHDGTHGQAVEVVIDENQDTQNEGSQLSAHAGLDVGLGPATEGGGATGLVDQRNHHAQQNQENQDTNIPGVTDLSDQNIGGVGDHAPGIEIGIQQRTGQNTDEQGRIYFLGDQCQGDRNHRRQQRPDSCIAADGSAQGFDRGLDIGFKIRIGTYITGIIVHIAHGLVRVRVIGCGRSGGKAAQQCQDHRHQN